MEFMTIYWPVLLVGVLIGVITGYLVFRPRQSVRLSDDRPVRPHMVDAAKPTGDARGLVGDTAAAAGDVGGQNPNARADQGLPGATGAPDDLQKLKGVGPKFAGMLAERGIVRFDQLAQLSPDQIEILDAEMGPFRGRFERDRIVAQADCLARGDFDQYQAEFGNL